MNNEEKIIQMLGEMNTRLDKIEDRLDKIEDRTARTELLIENTIIPDIKLLFEGQVTIQNQIKRISVIDRLEDDVSTLKSAVRFLSGEVEALKKAV